MLWTIVIGIVGFTGILIAIAVAFLAYVSISSSRKERRVSEQGKPVLTVMVMANSELQKPDGWPSVPGLVVFGFYKPTPELAKRLKVVATRTYELYAKDDLDSLSVECRNFALRLKDHNYTEDRRFPVPSEISESLSLFVADLWVYRERIPESMDGRTELVCAVTGDQEGEIIHLPTDDPRAIEIYRAASNF